MFRLRRPDRRPKIDRRPAFGSRSRRAFFEPLEDRRMLAVIQGTATSVVGGLNDFVYEDFNTGSGDDRLLLVSLAGDSSSTTANPVSSVTFGGIPLTPAASVGITNGDFAGFWYLPLGSGAPIVGDVAFNTSTVVSGALSVSIYRGVDQSEPIDFGATTSVVVGQNSSSLSVVTEIGDLVVDVISVTASENAGLIRGPGQQFLPSGGAGNTVVGRSYEEPVSANVTMSWTIINNLPVQPGVHVAVNINQANEPPVAQANGPYSVDEGASIALSSAGSNDPDGSIVAYEWDLDYDGTFNATSTSASPNFSAAGIDGPATRTVALRVRDNSGIWSTIDTAQVTIENVSPSNLQLDLASTSIDEGSQAVLSGTFDDPSATDAHRVTIDWGDGSPLQTIDLPGGVTSFSGVTHEYPDDGPSPGNGTLSDVYSINVTVEELNVAFQIASLTANNATVIDHYSITGDDRGGIALSASHVFYNGDGALGRFSTSGLTGGTSLPRNDAIVSNLRTKQLYVLGSSSSAALIWGTGAQQVTHLIELDSLGAPTGGSIALSQPISLETNNYNTQADGVFAGWDRILLFVPTTEPAGQVYRIDLPSGNVTNLGTVSLNHQGGENWAIWGVAETIAGQDYLTYVQNGFSIARTRVSDGTTTTVANFPAGLFDMAGFTVDPQLGRWYFHHESSSGTFGGGVETLGYADATFTLGSSGSGSTAASIDLTVVNVDPIAATHQGGVFESTIATINTLTAAEDVGALDVLSAVAASGVTPHGASYSIDANGQATYDPNGAFEYLGVGQTATDSFSYTIVDDDGGSSTSTITINIYGQNDAPVLDLNGPDGAGIDFSAGFVEGGGELLVVDGDLTLTDAEGTIESATVTITNLLDGTDELLAADTSGTGIGASYDSGTGVLTLTGSASAAEYQAVLRTVTYNNTSTDPDATPRVIEFVASDGIDASATATTTVQVTPVSEISLEVSPASVVEDGSGNLVFTFTRTAPLGEQTIPFSISGSATFGGADADYTVSGATTFDGSMGTVTFADGSATATITIDPVADSIAELAEQIALTLTAGAGYNLTTTEAVTGEIVDDDEVVVALSGVGGDEDTGAVNLTFTITGQSDAGVTLFYNDSPIAGSGYATAGVDYSPFSSSVYFTPGPSGRTITVELPNFIADDIVELDELIHVIISGSNAAGRNLQIAPGGDSAMIEIANDESATVSIDSVSGLENGLPLAFTITLSDPVDVPVFFAFQTQVVGNPGALPPGVNAATAADFQVVGLSGGQFISGIGPQTVTFEVSKTGEDIVELDEVFEAVISNLNASGRNVSFGNSVGVGTILNDDSATLSISSQSALEGADVDGEGNGQTFTVTLSAPVDTTISFGVDSQQVAGGAIEGVDYAEVAFTGTIAPEDGVSQTYFVSISDDATVELDEVFELLLSNLNADGRAVTLGTALGTTTIQNDDQATLTIAAAAADEDTGELTFDVTLSHAVDVPVAVDVSTLDVALEALAGSDYVASTATLSFAGNAGETQQFTVTLNPDTVYEDDEDFQAQLGAVDAQGRDVTAVTTPVLGTIVNDDALPSVTISASPTVISEAGGVSTVTVELSNPSENPVVVELALSGSASVGVDYGISATSITLDPLDVSGSVTLTATLDALSDDAETAVVAIDSVTGGEEDGEQAASILILEGYDFGDAPASYGTLNAASPHHLRSTIGVHLGTLLDFDPNGQPSAAANGDDLLGWDDEDGVTLPSQLVARVGANIIVNASEAGRLDAWIDFNRNGVFDAAEKIANNLPVVAGDTTLFVDVPADAVAGLSYARFRISSVGGLGPIGFAPNGEVEDYAIQIVRPAAGGITLTDDPLNPGQTMVVVQGTWLSDTVVVQPIYYLPGWALVSYAGQIPVPVELNSISRFVIFGEGSSDSIAIDAAITTPAYVYGDAGNDSIVGGGGDDYLYGGAGNDSVSGNGGNDVLLGEADLDMLYGGLGRDLLIGGAGQDWLYGQDEDDILIGSNGPTLYPTLAAIKSAWSTSQSFGQRVTALSSMLNAATVTDDGLMDYIYGNGGNDWQIDFQNRDFFLDYFFLQDRKN